MRMKSVGLLAGIALIGNMLSCVKANVAGINGTDFIWVATQGNEQVSAFSIDLTTGKINAIGTNQATGAQPSAMAITPDGKALFIANTSDNTIGAYTVSSDGTLTAAQGTTPTMVQGPNGCVTNCTLGLSPVAMAVDPSGAFLFVAEQGQPNNAAAPGGLSAFKISGTSLTPVGPACPAGFSLPTCPFTLADPVTGFSLGPSAVVAAPGGMFLYVAETFSNQVESFSYDATGTLQAIKAFSTGNNPSALAFSRCSGITSATINCAAADANTLFLANAGSDTLSTFAACIQVSTTCSSPDGNLVETSGSPVAAGTAPVAIAVNPAGNTVFVVNANSNTLSQYKYLPATGALSPQTPASISTGASPFGGGVTSDGTFVIVSNNNGSSMSAYSITSTGRLALAPTPSVTLAGQPSAILIR